MRLPHEAPSRHYLRHDSPGMNTQAGPVSMYSRRIAGPEKVVLLGALAMLVASAYLGATGADSGGPTGATLGVHASAGSLGWMTLGSMAVALSMLRGGDSDQGPDHRDHGAGKWLAWLAVAALAASVGIGAIGSPAASAATATVGLLAVASFIAWLEVVRR